MTGRSLFTYGFSFGLKSSQMYRDMQQQQSLNKKIPKTESQLLKVYVFLPYPSSRRFQVMNKTRALIKRIVTSKQMHVVFLQQKHAFQYSRYYGEACTIVKAYVEESAISANETELFIKQHALTPENIIGIYMSNQNEAKYLPNPAFLERAPEESK